MGDLSTSPGAPFGPEPMAIPRNPRPAEASVLARELAEARRQHRTCLAVLAHELRHPLAPLVHALQLLRLDGVAEEQRGRAIAIMERQIAHLVRLVDELLDVGRLDHGKLTLRIEAVDLAEAVFHAVESVRPHLDARAQSVRLRLGSAPLVVRGDPGRLLQIACNLLSNASKFSAQGGEITVSLARSEEEAVLRVRDGGIGIEPALLPHVFEMFAQGPVGTSANDGLGIGLALVRRLAEAHGGTATAHSAGPGAGSEFVVRLPVEGPASRP